MIRPRFPALLVDPTVYITYTLVYRRRFAGPVPIARIRARFTSATRCMQPRRVARNPGEIDAGNIDMEQLAGPGGEL